MTYPYVRHDSLTHLIASSKPFSSPSSIRNMPHACVKWLICTWRDSSVRETSPIDKPYCFVENLFEALLCERRAFQILDSFDLIRHSLALFFGDRSLHNRGKQNYKFEKNSTLDDFDLVRLALFFRDRRLRNLKKNRLQKTEIERRAFQILDSFDLIRHT